MTSCRRAVITGVGVLSPIGLDAASFWLPPRRPSGVRPITAFDPSTLPVRFAGEIPDFDAKNYVDKKDRRGLKMMARTIQLAVGAAQLALNDAAVDKTKLVPERFGVEFGAGLIATELPELADASRVSANGRVNHIDLEKWGAEGIPIIQPLWMLKYLPNMLACHVSILHDARGPNNSDHRGRRLRPAGAGRGVPHPRARPGRLLPGRRRREQDQPAEPGAAVPLRAAVAPQRRPGEGVSAVRPRPRRPRGRRGRRRVRAGGTGTREAARRPDLRRGGRFRRGVQPGPHRATAWRGPCGPP